jgi:catechol 2,3-dioxygenase-like lactoylglutathione lyase family enzyme
VPNLDYLRKKAKLYVRWHRDGYYPVAAQIRTMLQRFRHLTDRQVLQQPFKLSDAQHLVARQRGFESWQALQNGVRAMTDNTPAVDTSTDPAGAATAPATDRQGVFAGLEAQLYVADVQAACGFYVEKLGFAVAFTYGEPPFYGQVRREGVSLNLRYVEGPVFVEDIRRREHLLAATVLVRSGAALRRLFQEFETAGVPFHQPLRQEPWGARTFVIEDPDGNLVLFTGPAV